MEAILIIWLSSYFGLPLFSFSYVFFIFHVVCRIQIGQSGSANVPLVTEAELYLAGLKEFEIRVNFTSNSTEEPGVGLAVGNTVDEWDEHKCSMNGIVGGHWKENEASIKYSLKTAKNADSASYDVSLFGVVPFSTESVAKPQRVGLDMFYKVG